MCEKRDRPGPGRACFMTARTVQSDNRVSSVVTQVDVEKTLDITQCSFLTVLSKPEVREEM